MRPNSLADALICAKAKLASFASGERKQTFPPNTQGPFRPQKIAFHIQNPHMNTAQDHKIGCFANPRPNILASKLPIQSARVNAIPKTYNDRGVQCYDCKQWGHRKAECPNKKPKRGRLHTALLPQERVFVNRQGDLSPGENPGPTLPIKVNYIRASNEAKE